jgi:hypothetical protein
MRIERLLLLLALSFVSMMTSVETALACQCAPIKLAEAKRKSDAVFAGTVVRVKRRSVGGDSIKFRMERVWKGEKTGEIEIYSGAGCDAPFKVGRRYLVFGYLDKDNRLKTDGCMVVLGAFDEHPEELRKLGTSVWFRISK